MRSVPLDRVEQVSLDDRANKKYLFGIRTLAFNVAHQPTGLLAAFEERRTFFERDRRGSVLLRREVRPFLQLSRKARASTKNGVCGARGVFPAKPAISAILIFRA